MGKIESIIKEETINYGSHIIENCIIPRDKKEIKISEIMDKIVGKFIVTGQGRTLINKIVECIRSAKEFICLSSFILTEAQIIKELKIASKRNIRVYILTAPEQHLKKENPEVDVKKEDIKIHKEILNELTYITLIRTAPHLHSKFIIVDPKSENAKGILSTANFSSRELTENPDIGVVLTRSEIKDLFKQFIRAFWKESERELLEEGNLSVIGDSPYSNKQLKLPRKLLTTMKDSSTLKEKILEMFKDVNPETDEIIISIYSIINDFSVTKTLLDLVKRGTKVTILTRFRTINIPTLISLRKKGARILVHDRVHCKAIIVQGGLNRSILMTSNISELGLESGFESGIIFASKDTEHLKQVLNSWINHFPYEFFHQKKLKDLPEQGYYFEEKEGIINFKIQQETTKKMGKLIASSIELMNEMKPTSFPEIRSKGDIYRKCIYEWEVEPPKLPKNAKKIDIGVRTDFEVYETKNSKYLVITDTKDLKKAEKIAKEIRCKIVLPK